MPGAGGTWSRDGVILFGSTEGLFRVPASGGVPQQVTQRDTARKESGHGVPQFLPDGKRFLYFIQSTDPNTQGIYAGSLDNPKERVRILATDRKAYYVPARDGRTGFLLWVREQTLLAQPFDAAKLRLEGDPTPLAEEVAVGLHHPRGFLDLGRRTAGVPDGRSVRQRKVALDQPGRQTSGRSGKRGSLCLYPAFSRRHAGGHEPFWR